MTNIASNNNNANNMNTIAILPGGREICHSLPCKKEREKRETGKQKESRQRVKTNTTYDKYYTDMTQNSYRMEDYSITTCLNKTRGVAKDKTRHEIFLHAAITLHLFEDLLDIKKHSNIVKGN